MSKLKWIYFLPWWMNTFWGRWLSENWPPAIAYRDALTDSNAHLRAEYDAEWRTNKVLRAVGACIQSNFNEEFRRQLTDFYVDWQRSAAEKNHAAMILSRRR